MQRVSRRKPTNKKKFKGRKDKKLEQEKKAAIALLMKMSKQHKLQLGWYDRKPKLGVWKWAQQSQSA